MSLYSKSSNALFKNALETPNVKSLKLAEQFCLWEAKRDFENRLAKGDLRRLNTCKVKQEIIVVGGCLEK